MNASVPSPYKGLRPYEEQDRDNFFGREKECRILIDKILANKLTLLFAASGVGKSSLLQAAVLPRLKDPRHENRDGVYYNDWVSPPLEGLKQQVLKTLQQQSLLENVALPAELPERSLNEFFSFCALFTRQPLVVVLDQFEEFFQYQRHTTDFKPFIQQLSAVVTDRDAPIAVVIAMREDFALELNAFKPTLPTLLFENFYRLERLDQANARKAIEEPAQRVSFRFDPALLEVLLKDLAAREQRGSATIPLAEELDTVEPAYLQIVCSQLWEVEQHNPDRSLRLHTYQAKGRAAGILKNYVESIIGGFSPGDKKLASKAFDHLITRRGTKMAYTAGDLAQLLGVNGEALGKVLDRLEASRILRRQSRHGVFWYELYHDLFSKPIEEWNEVYKAKQRNRRALLLVGVVVMAGFALYGAYDIVMNYTSYHLRLSAKQGVSDGIELYRGKTGSHDILGLQGYIAETGYLRSQVEPDKLFDNKAVGDYDVLNGELIGNLPLTERIAAYWDDGQTNKALELARRSISEYDALRSNEIANKLADFRSLRAIRLLMDRLEQISDSNLKEKIIVALGTTRTTDAFESLLNLQNDPNLKIRLAVVQALSQLGSPRAVEPLARGLADAKACVRVAAAEALGRLGDPRAVEPLVRSLADAGRDVRSAHREDLCWTDRDVDERWAGRDVRRTAAEALGELGDPRAVESLVRYLADADAGVRVAAAEALGRLGDPRAVEPLTRIILADADASVRRTTAEALGRLGDPRAVEPLVRVLADADASVRRTAAEVLGKLGDPRAVEPLAQVLADTDASVRRVAAEVLGRLGDPRGIDLLVRDLAAAHPSKHQDGVIALVHLGGPRAVEPLTRSLADADASVRRTAAEVLGELGDPRAVDPLARVLADADARMRWAATQALGRLGDPRAVEPLVRSLADADASVRQTAAGALGRLGDPRAVEPLVRVLADASVRRAAAEALVRLGDPRAVEPLLARGLAAAGAGVRVATAEALGRLGDPRAVEALVRGLADANAGVRRIAAEALGRLGDATASKSLLQRLDDQDAEVRKAVLLALGKIGDHSVLDAVATAFHKPQEERPARMAAAMVLLKFNRDDGLSLLTELGGSNKSTTRQELAKTLGAFPTTAGNQLLTTLLEDKNLEVKLIAIQSLGNIQATNVLPALQTLLRNSNIQSQTAAAEALSRIASPDSIPALQTVLLDSQTAIPVRRAALTALNNIGTDESIQIILEAVEKDEPILGLHACRELGGKDREKALPWLSKRLKEIEGQYREWRRIRDSERPDFSEEQGKQWAEQLKAAEPQRFSAFPIAQAIARIDPNGKGFSLLSHDLADVRAGAWTGLSQAGNVKLLERLHAEHQASREPLFRHAAYRAIDLLLIRLGGNRKPQDRTDLEAFYNQVKDVEGVGERVEWTLNQLKERFP